MFQKLHLDFKNQLKKTRIAIESYRLHPYAWGHRKLYFSKLVKLTYPPKNGHVSKESQPQLKFFHGFQGILPEMAVKLKTSQFNFLIVHAT